MKPQVGLTPIAEAAWLKPLYLLLLLLLGLTGFAQMPIFSRYYIADIPGLGWLDRYYVTHTLHYLGAIGLLALVAYCVVVYFALLRRRHRLTTVALVRIVLLTAIVATGILRVVKNLPDIVFSPGFTMFIDITHLGFMMLYMLAALVAPIFGKRWLRDRFGPA